MTNSSKLDEEDAGEGVDDIEDDEDGARERDGEKRVSELDEVAFCTVEECGRFSGLGESPPSPFRGVWLTNLIVLTACLYVLIKARQAPDIDCMADRKRTIKVWNDIADSDNCRGDSAGYRGVSLTRSGS